jgi:hypothetical protein
VSVSIEQLRRRSLECPAGPEILEQCMALAAMLIEKNIAYGDSALDPVRVFSRGMDASAQILVRIDDKLSRIARGSAAGEDAVLDLLGYLVLYRIASARQARQAHP